MTKVVPGDSRQNPKSDISAVVVIARPASHARFDSLGIGGLKDMTKESHDVSPA